MLQQLDLSLRNLNSNNYKIYLDSVTNVVAVKMVLERKGYMSFMNKNDVLSLGYNKAWTKILCTYLLNGEKDINVLYPEFIIESVNSDWFNVLGFAATLIHCKVNDWDILIPERIFNKFTRKNQQEIMLNLALTMKINSELPDRLLPLDSLASVITIVWFYGVNLPEKYNDFILNFEYPDGVNSAIIYLMFNKDLPIVVNNYWENRRTSNGETLSMMIVKYGETFNVIRRINNARNYIVHEHPGRNFTMETLDELIRIESTPIEDNIDYFEDIAEETDEEIVSDENTNDETAEPPRDLPTFGGNPTGFRLAGNENINEEH